MKRFYYYCLVASASLWAQSPTINPFPSREFGQPQLLQSLTSTAPNLVEGRELNGPGAIAFDTSVSPPILYVADTNNHRVLAFQNPDNFSVCTTSGASTCGFASSKVIISQRDLSSTLPQGPGRDLSAGVTYPTALAVDSSGNLYVADSGNNRILRYPAPFKQTSVLLAVDLVIGQQSPTTGNLANQGLPAPTNQTLALFIQSLAGGVTPAGLAFDPSGNLWVSDPGNNRVLRFPKVNNGIQTTADRVLGQFDFVTKQAQQPPAGTTVSTQQFKGSLGTPSGLAFDNNGNLYVADAFSRVMYYSNPSSGNGIPATRILGIDPPPTSTAPSPTYPNQFTLGAPNVNNQLVPPLCVFTNGTNAFVCDSAMNRIAVYDVPANWPAETTALPSPPMLRAIGQNDLTSGKVNKGQALPDATTLSFPLAGAFLGTELWVADSNNNRVLAFTPQTGLTYTTATRLIGQLDFPFNAQNLVEGREVFFATGGTGSADVVVDANSNPPHLYIADSLNNRVLGFNDARTVQQTSKADIVIGQPDLFHSGFNYPSGCTGTTGANPCLGQNPGNMGLAQPSGLVVDTNGDLFVADTGNGRVLRFASPFKPGATLQANLVLGQVGFGPATQNPSQQNMGLPFGLAINADGINTALYVSDTAYNRVLVFKHAPGGDFTNGQLADLVLGQPNFSSITKAVPTATAPASPSGMNAPAHIAVDSSDRLYVADGANNRILVFTNAKFASNGAASVLQIPNLNSPQGVAVSPITGEVWVANTNAGQVLRYPEFNTILLNGSAIKEQIPFASAVLAITLDPFGNPIAAESANRVSFFFPLIVHRNIANFNQNGIAPGMLTYIGRADGANFGLANAQATLPLPKQLSDVQVTVNGTPAPIYIVQDPYIYFEAPMSSPTSGTVDVLVTRVSTGQVLADAMIPAVAQNPGFLTANAQGSGQVAAYNAADGTVNSQANPVARGGIIVFVLTGQGFVANAGPDGAAPPNPPVSTALPTVITSYGLLDSTACATAPNKQCVQFSGLAQFPGIWQINLFIPPGQAPGQSRIVVTLNDQPSTSGPNGSLTTTFWVK